MIVTNNQHVLITWLCDRIKLAPTRNIRCIGRLNAEGNLIGVVGFDNFTGASAAIHIAGEGNWLSRRLLWVVFDYAFVQNKLKVLFAQVSTGNPKSLKLNLHIGFKQECVLKDVFTDGDAVITSLRAEDCKYLERKEHGQVI